MNRSHSDHFSVVMRHSYPLRFGVVLMIMLSNVVGSQSPIYASASPTPTQEPLSTNESLNAQITLDIRLIDVIEYHTDR